MSGKTCKRGHPLHDAYVIPSTGKRRCRRCKVEVYDVADRQRIRERAGLPPPSPYLGRFAISRPITDCDVSLLTAE